MVLDIHPHRPLGSPGRMVRRRARPGRDKRQPVTTHAVVEATATSQNVRCDAYAAGEGGREGGPAAS